MTAQRFAARMPHMEGQRAATVERLETPCPICEGSAGHAEQGEWVSCGYCSGAGYLPTEDGKRVLDLIRHNLPLMLSEAART